MTTTTAAEADLEPLVADLRSIRAGQIAVRDVKIDDMRPDSRSHVVVYLTPPDPGSRWNLDDFSAVRARVRDLVSSSALGDDTRITTSDGDPSAPMERPVHGTKALVRPGRR